MQFKVLISGRDFTLEGRSGERRVGFFTSRMVAAEDREEAERLAVEQICDELRSSENLDARMEPASSLNLERVEEVNGDGLDALEICSHFTFFMQDDR